MPRYGLNDKARPDWSLKPSWKPIVAEIMARHPGATQISVNLNRGHNGGETWIRFELFWTLYHRLGASRCEIGRRLGDFDPTTVAYGIRRWQEHLDEHRLADAA